MENPLHFLRFDYTYPCHSCTHPSVGYHTELLEVGVHLPTLCGDLVPEAVVGHRVAAELDHLVPVPARERFESVHSVDSTRCSSAPAKQSGKSLHWSESSCDLRPPAYALAHTFLPSGLPNFPHLAGWRLCLVQTPLPQSSRLDSSILPSSPFPSPPPDQLDPSPVWDRSILSLVFVDYS